MSNAFFPRLNWLEHRVGLIKNTLQGTNISPKNGVLKMIFLFPRWDMLIPWRVHGIHPLKPPNQPSSPVIFVVFSCLFSQWLAEVNQTALAKWEKVRFFTHGHSVSSS